MKNRQFGNKFFHEVRNYNAIFVCLLLLIVILPWPHGGEVTWQYLMLCFCIFTLASVVFISSVYSERHTFHDVQSIRIPLAILVVWILFQLLQLIPLPISFSNLTSQNLGSPKWQMISIAANLSIIEIIKHLSYIAFFVMSILLVTTRSRLLKCVNALFFCSSAIAIYSIYNHFTHGSFDLISSIPPWTIDWSRATHGTFSYQNHYASFLTLTIPLGFGLLYNNVIETSNQITNNINQNVFIQLIMPKNILYLLSILIMWIALVKTSSRGGNAAFILSILVTFFCVILLQNKSYKTKFKNSALVLCGTTFIGVIALISGITGSLSEKLNSQGLDTHGRDLMHKTAFTIIKERPLVGTGAGTYPVVQHRYKSPLLGSSAVSQRAHNEYLELLSNQGVIGFSLLGLATTLLYFRLFKGLKRSRNPNTQSLYGLQVASFCSVTAILIHSLADFNFHLPANAVYYYLILAIGLQIGFLNEKLTQKKSNKKPS